MSKQVEYKCPNANCDWTGIKREMNLDYNDIPDEDDGYLEKHWAYVCPGCGTWHQLEDYIVVSTPSTNQPITGYEFDQYFKSLSDTDLLKWLGENIKNLTLNNRQGYIINSVDDLKAVVEQELYQGLTGRE